VALHACMAIDEVSTIVAKVDTNRWMV